MKVVAEQLKSKKDFEALMLAILNPLKGFYTEEKAGLDIGSTSAHYENKTVLLEAFSRPLWALVPFWAGGGEDETFEAIYKKGLVAGSNPKGAEYWGECRDFDQKLVEMAAIAYGILMTPEKLWDPLSEEEKENLVQWLSGINQYECCLCNWQFFCILVNVALKSKNRTYSKERLESGLAYIDSYYEGDGWYNDGEDGQKDYYVSFAIHFYSLVYAMYMEEEDPNRCKVYRDRAETFAKEFIYWFAEDGSALPYGRSMTYRFAQVAFFSMCVVAKLDVYPIGVMKGLIVRHLVDWLNAPIFDKSGLLTIGYKYPNLQMAESYNAPGSPYWAMKTFAFLALKEDDVFWSIEAKPLPELSSFKTLKHADMIIQRKSGHVTAFVPGRTLSHKHAHTEEKYSKFAYSTKYGFSVARSQKTLQEAAPDSMLSFEVGGYIFSKSMTKTYQIEEKQITMTWSPFQGIEVTTKIVLTDFGHIREHEITSEYACTAYDCGFGVSIDDRAYSERMQEKESALVKNEEGFCQVRATWGKGEGRVLVPDPNTNLIYSKTAIPMIRYEIEKGTTRVVTEVSYE